MNANNYTYQDLWEIIEFLAFQEGKTANQFISRIRQEINEHDQKLAFLSEQLLSLSKHERNELLKKIDNDNNVPTEYVDKAISKSLFGKYALQELIDFNVESMVRTKPEALYINGEKLSVHSWKDLSIAFVNYLIDHGDLKRENLPFCPNKNSPKAFVNFFPGQPANVRQAGLFVKIRENFYVDIKHNAKYHILNLWWSLETLDINNKYSIEIEI